MAKLTSRPRRYAAHPTGRPVLVCAGDSITHGLMCANWVREVARSIAADMDTVNAGITGNLAWNLLRRLDDVIACRPTAVTVLIGTNDALAQISPQWSDGYMKRQRLPQRPTAQWYRHNLERIVDRLKSETSASIALMSLPPLGDATTGRWADLIARYNEIIQDVAAPAAVPVLPVHERIAGLTPANTPAAPWDGTKKLMGVTARQRMFLRRSWNTIAKQHGFTTTTDGVHLSGLAAAQIAELVEQLVRGSGVPNGCD
jgi:lysophospholipase L1-like esterase